MACDGIMRATTVWIIDMFQLERFDIFLYRAFGTVDGRGNNNLLVGYR